MSSQEKWDERYRENDLPWETGHASTELQRVLAEETIDRGRAIDIGCGTGANAVLLAQQGFEVVGVDFSPTAIERALARAGEANAEAEFVVADLLDPPDLGEPFTFFFDRGCYHVLRRDGHTADYIKTLARWTVPGARGLVLAGNAREKQEPGP
ncbi:MAG: class I SAM-dependent methyltransferase, partial [Gemmataceae bacterium]